MQAQGHDTARKLARSAQDARNRARTGRTSANPGKRLYGLPSLFFAADALPTGR